MSTTLYKTLMQILFSQASYYLGDNFLCEEYDIDYTDPNNIVIREAHDPADEDIGSWCVTSENILGKWKYYPSYKSQDYQQLYPSKELWNAFLLYLHERASNYNPDLVQAVLEGDKEKLIAVIEKAACCMIGGSNGKMKACFARTYAHYCSNFELLKGKISREELLSHFPTMNLIEEKDENNE